MFIFFINANLIACPCTVVCRFFLFPIAAAKNPETVSSKPPPMEMKLKIFSILWKRFLENFKVRDEEKYLVVVAAAELAELE